MQTNKELQSGRNIQKVLINYEWDRAAVNLEMNPLVGFGDGDHSVDNLLLLLLLLLLSSSSSSSSSYILCRVFILIFLDKLCRYGIIIIIIIIYYRCVLSKAFSAWHFTRTSGDPCNRLWNESTSRNLRFSWECW